MIRNSRLLLFTVLIFISVITLLYIQFKAYSTYTDTIKETKLMQFTAKDIKYLDEVLTMSARMAAFTGDQEWIKRYNKHVKLLDQQLNYIMKDKEVASLILEVKTANDKLVQLEVESFNLVKINQYKKAQLTLSSEDYLLSKERYSKALNDSIVLITLKSKEILKAQKNNFLMILYITIFLIILLVIFNFFIIKILRKYTTNLEYQKELYNLVTDSSPYGILFIDIADKKFISCNEEAVKLLEYTDKNTLINKHPDELSPEYQSDGMLSLDKSNKMIQLALKNKTHSFEWEHLKSNGETIWIEVTLSKININKKDIIHVVWKEIADRKKAEDELKNLYKNLEEKVKVKTQENREKDKLLSEQAKMASMGEMIGNIAHQWRQPLSIISSGATGMKIQKQFGTLEDEVFEKICDTINDNAQYLSATIDDFRNFIKDNRKLSQFKLKDTIDSLFNLIEPSIKKHNIDCIFNIDESIEILGYQNELIQSLMNIFNNAKDALNSSQYEEKLIFIDICNTKDSITIKFKDNGGGIPEEILPRVFEPYFTTKHQAHGTGLGLSMVYSLIVEGMKGSIEVQNVSFDYQEKKYLGAEFIITLSNKEPALI